MVVLPSHLSQKTVFGGTDGLRNQIQSPTVLHNMFQIGQIIGQVELNREELGMIHFNLRNSIPYQSFNINWVS
jgi:hypothetical protein